MTSLNFVLRATTKTGKPGSLSLQVTHVRKSKTITLPIRLFSEEWDAGSQSVLCSSDDPERTAYLLKSQERLADYKDRINQIISDLKKKGEYVVDDIATRFHHSIYDGNLLVYAQRLAEELVENGQYRTAKAYITASRGLVAFNKGVDPTLAGIKASLIKRFERHLKELGKHPNTISYYMRNLRAIYNKAVISKRIPAAAEKPFADVFTGLEATSTQALSIEELIQLKNIDFNKILAQLPPSSQQYNEIRDLQYAWCLFFFSLYAQGISFVDLCFLKKSDINGNEIHYCRRRSGGQMRVPINKGMQKIMQFFADEVKSSPYLFPILQSGMDNRAMRARYEAAICTQNRRLKKLGQLAGIDKKITTHVARHVILANQM